MTIFYYMSEGLYSPSLELNLSVKKQFGPLDILRGGTILNDITCKKNFVQRFNHHHLPVARVAFWQFCSISENLYTSTILTCNKKYI